MLDVLDRYLCDSNPNRKRSLVLNLHSNAIINSIRNRIDKFSLPKLKKHVTTDNFGFFDIDKIFIPVVHSLHFTMYVVFMESQDIVYYDSLNLAEPEILKSLDVLAYIEYEAKTVGRAFNAKSWKFVRAEVVSQQNGLDCGYCVIKHGLLVMHDLPLDLEVSINLTYSIWHMRTYMAYENIQYMAYENIYGI